MRASGSARAPASRRRFRSPTRRHGIWLFCSLKYTISQGFVSRPINSFSTSSLMQGSLSPALADKECPPHTMVNNLCKKFAFC
jgi:hypothetical protein